MQFGTGIRGILILALLGGSGAALYPSSQQSQESVAEAARKARAQKKAAANAPKVITDDDLRPSAPAAGTESAAQGDKKAGEQAGKEGQAAASEGGKAAAPEKKDEQYWRTKFQAAREDLARAEKELNILQREVQKASSQYYPDPNKALQEQYNRKEINEKNEKIDAKKKEITALRQAIEDLETELRRSGGDPGWAR